MKVSSILHGMDECEQYEANSQSNFRVTLANFSKNLSIIYIIKCKITLYEIGGPLPNLKGADHFSNEAPLPK